MWGTVNSPRDCELVAVDDESVFGDVQQLSTPQVSRREDFIKTSHD